jgi:prolyl 4-hydroxylase
LQFEPTGHSLRHNANIERDDRDVHLKYKDALARGVGGHENDNHGLPPYIIPGTPEEAHWRANNKQYERNPPKMKSFTTGSTLAHKFASDGDVEALQKEIEKKKEVIHAKDENGWQPIHEAARGGHVDVVRLLVENGADLNAKTADEGGTPLWWAKQELGEDHPVVAFLEEIGGLDVGPEL